MKAPTLELSSIAKNDCYGGMARLVTAVRREKERARMEAGESENGAVFLYGGDFFQGNAWYSIFKWKVVAPFTNILNFTAMVLLADASLMLFCNLMHTTFLCLPVAGESRV